MTEDGERDARRPDARSRPAGIVRRAVDGALDATVGRVGQSVTDAAREVTEATAQQVIDDLEPYLVEATGPRLLDGLTPHLVEVTAPAVLEGLTPYLAEALLPTVLEELRPYLSQELVPALIDEITPKIEQDTAQRILDALLPRIEAEVAPRLLDSLMPRIQAEVAPQLVEGLLPMIRTQVVPVILDDIVDDPNVRDLIRGQSQGLMLDVLESLRSTLANADTWVESALRRITRRPARVPDPSGLAIVLGDASPAQPLRRTWDTLGQRRRAWLTMPSPPAPPGRRFAHAGLVTWCLGLVADAAIVGWLVGIGLATVLGLLDRVLPGAPTWLRAGLAAIASGLVPAYLGLCWWFAGRTIGGFLTGTRVCTPDGHRPGPVVALLRAWLVFYLMPIWLAASLLSPFDARRRTLLDRLAHTEVRYVVPYDQQQRYLSAALSGPGAGTGAPGPARAEPGQPPSEPTVS